MTPTNDTTASAAKSEVIGNLVEDVNAIAYKYLEAFLQDVKNFKEVMYQDHRGNNDDTNEAMMKKHGDLFASFLEEKYLCQSLDKLRPSTINHDVNPIVEKSRALISRFIV